MPMLGSLYMLPYICLLQGYPSPNAYMQKCPSVYATIRVYSCFSICTYVRLSKDTYIYMAIYESLDMPKMLFYI